MSVKSLQTKIGVIADGSFGNGTLKAAMNFYKMSAVRASHFFGQTAHESGHFKVFSENLNYSAAGLLKVFPKYFKTMAEAQAYERKPEMIANRVYGNRMGNGAEASGEGFKFRGRGALQLTGKENYTNFSNFLNKPEILTNPDLVATEYAFESAIYFFERNGLWAICDKGVDDATITLVTKRINGGTIGLDERKILTKKYYEILKA
jgi:putative chitinase